MSDSCTTHAAINGCLLSRTHNAIRCYRFQSKPNTVVDMARGATVIDNLEKANSSVVCGSTYLRLLHAAATDVGGCCFCSSRSSSCHLGDFDVGGSRLRRACLRLVARYRCAVAAAAAAILPFGAAAFVWRNCSVTAASQLLTDATFVAEGGPWPTADPCLPGARRLLELEGYRWGGKTGCVVVAGSGNLYGKLSERLKEKRARNAIHRLYVFSYSAIIRDRNRQLSGINAAVVCGQPPPSSVVQWRRWSSLQTYIHWGIDFLTCTNVLDHYSGNRVHIDTLAGYRSTCDQRKHQTSLLA